MINYKLYPREEGEGVLASVVYTVILSIGSIVIILWIMCIIEWMNTV